MRQAGYQAVQWAVTVPISVPSGALPRATSPVGYAPLFVIDTRGPQELLARIATVGDFAALAQSELQMFDAKDSGGPDLYINARPGDVLRIVSPPSYWLQDEAPYTNTDFLVDIVGVRASGTSPVVASPNLLTLPNYLPSEEDIGRWVFLQGFATPENNGWKQLLGVAGASFQTSGNFVAPQAGTGWSFPRLRINPSADPSLEPKFFPTREHGLSWELHRGDPDATLPLAQGTGGVTSREFAGDFVRSLRRTYLAPSFEDAMASFTFSIAYLEALQAALTVSEGTFMALTTITEGP